MLTLILKGTNGCNLDCAYCSLGEKTQVECVTEEKLYQILRYVCRVSAFRGEKQLHIILHGGEPTLILEQIYQNALRKVKTEFPEMEMEISMQTNGFSISPGMLKFFKEFRVHVGVSVDGAEEIHDRQRRSRSGAATFQQVQKNIDLMLQEGIAVSCLMVLTSLGCRAPFDYLSFYEKRRLYLKINPLLACGEAEKNPYLFLKPGEYAEYLIRLYEHIVEHDIDITVAPLDQFLHASVQRKSMSECTFRARCNQNFLCVDPKGDIYPCGRFADHHTFCLGNVETAEIDILNNPNIQKLLARRDTNLPDACRKCRFAARCNAGCSAEADIERGMHCPPLLCEDYQRLFTYFEKEGLYFLRDRLQKKRSELWKEKNGL